MCSIDWDGDMKFWRDERRRARKPHRCDACLGAIEPGQTYVHHASLSGDHDRPLVERLCAACDALMEEFGKHDGHPPRTTPGSLDAYLSECLDNDDYTFDDEGERRPSAEAVRWQAMLDEMAARKRAAQAAAP